MRGFGTFAAAALLATLLLAPAAATAQVDQTNGERFERNLEQIRRETRARVARDVPAGQRALIDYGGYFTPSYLSFDDSQGRNHAFRGYDLVGYGRLNFDGVHDFYLRGRATYRDFNPGDSFERQPDHMEGHVEEAYYRFDLAAHNAAARGELLGEGNLTVQVGRQFQTWANGLVLSQYVDGGKLTVERGPIALDLIAAVTAEDLTVDFDASRPSFERETRRAYYGGLLSARLGAHRPYVYALVQRDQNGHGPADVGPVPTRFGYDSYYLGGGVNGSLSDRLSYGVEVVYEGGRALSSSLDAATFQPADQAEQDISAYAGELHLDYLFNDARRTRLGAGLLIASGDPDRADGSNTFAGNRAGTADHGFNALGFVDDGLAFSPTVSNLVVVRATASAYPFAGHAWLDQLQVGAEAYLFHKLRRDGPIDEPTGDARYLGWEPDLFVNWQMTDDLTLVLRYGLFFPGEAVPSDDVRQFFYAGLTYAF